MTGAVINILFFGLYAAAALSAYYGVFARAYFLIALALAVWGFECEWRIARLRRYVQRLEREVRK